MGLSLRQYAAHRRAAGLSGGTHRAVRMAIAAGRITAAPDGRIADPEQADQQWAATTLQDREPHTGRGARVARGAPRRATDAGPPAPPVSSPPAPEPRAPSRLQTLREQREEIAIERARFELDKELGRYVPEARVKEAIVGDYTICRNHLLGVPNQLGQRWPGKLDEQARAVINLVDELIRNALEQLGSGYAFQLARELAKKSEGT